MRFPTVLGGGLSALGVISLAFTGLAPAPATTDGVVDGNPTCVSSGIGGTEIKNDPPSNTTIGGVTFTYSADHTYVTVTSDGSVTILGIIIKGGDEAVIDTTPPFQGTAPPGPQGQLVTISHVTACVTATTTTTTTTLPPTTTSATTTTASSTTTTTLATTTTSSTSTTSTTTTTMPSTTTTSSTTTTTLAPSTTTTTLVDQGNPTTTSTTLAPTSTTGAVTTLVESGGGTTTTLVGSGGPTSTVTTGGLPRTGGDDSGGSVAVSVILILSGATLLAATRRPKAT